ncbi:penicillin-binding transpeptidase domain-containing protein [Actinomadura alba]|uniref:Penicillin-binding protein 2 n=1 Tax=Actinomadura alba TaxID=406431 RepID=A0ABR7LUP3_9ACTN|nr:penicillin-binding transpeptidase domain-containing protein [Actinomadura alba]MBC6468480.1 penicillin-binding protein 2 [Actinomadura alba]
MDLDKPLRRVSIFALLLILALMINVNYIQGSEAENLRNDKLNSRQYADVFNRDRGSIIAGSETLASSKESGKSNPKYQRDYKEGLIFSPVTGFFSSNGGQSGLEVAYSSLLDGQDKRLTAKRWFDSFIGKPTKGANVVTTIDPRAQRAAYNALKGTTDRRAAAVVMDIKTGALKVVASYPSFDPERIAPQTGEKGSKELQRLDKADFKPLVNKALNETFPPGSSFKTVVAAIEMTEKGLNLNSTVRTDPLILPETGRRLPNSHEGGACKQTAPLISAFAESCNTTFGRMALDMKAATLNSGAAKFGFGKKIPVEPDLLSAESDVPTKEPTGQPLGGDNLGRSGIGQANVRATPLQMAMVAAAVANKGKIMKPYLVDKVRADDQSELYSANPQEFAQAMSSGVADDLKQMMLAVVTTGTATNLQGRNIAGKTGTAETGIGSLNSRWFVGYSPVESPRYAFAVVTEGPGSAATNAGNLAATIMSAVRR